MVLVFIFVVIGKGNFMVWCLYFFVVDKFIGMGCFDEVIKYYKDISYVDGIIKGM